jgi:phosphoenolpyruvate phosphomutase
MKKSSKLRQLFEKKEVIRIVGAHDGLTAKLVEKNGFDGVWAGGFEISTSYALPDANILTMTQFLEAASIMNNAVSIPVIADCDTGFGNSNNVIHMVKKYEERGIAAVCIEDKKFPKVNSFIPGRQELAPISEFVGKIMAAKNAQETDDFMVFARVEALIAGWGQEEALRRAYAYANAGADGIFIHSKSKSPKEIINFINSWSGDVPLIICPTTYSSITLQEIQELGKVKMIIYANHGIRASIRAVDEILSRIYKIGTTTPIENKIASMNEVFELQGMPELKEHERRYLRSEREAIRTIIPAAGDNRNIPSFKSILRDTPLTMLDVNGKSILQRNIEVLNNVGIQDISVVSGYQGKKIDLEGIKKIQNDDYRKTHVLNSVMLGIGKEKFEGRTLIAYSDILFDQDLIEKLLKKDDDITLVIDSSFKTSKFRKRDVDLVITKYPPIKGRRQLNIGRHNPILKIGKDIPREEANYEFVGIALFSENGLNILKKLYEKSKVRYYRKKFHEAKSFEKASFTDMIQELIDNGIEISSLEVNSGWTEVHTFEDYKRACSMLAHK